MQLSASAHTVRSYETAISLYIAFLESEKGITASTFSKACFEKNVIEDWLAWLSDERKCSPDTCNNRLASIRSFLKYLGDSNIAYLYLTNEADTIKARKTQKKKIHRELCFFPLRQSAFCCSSGQRGEHWRQRF